MKTLGTILLLALLLGADSLAAEQPVALILRHSGGVKVDGAPVRGVLRVAPGIKLEIPAGATASVVFFADNHREDIKGPCRPVIQASGSQGVPASQLTRTSSRGKLTLDRSMGNTQSMAGTSLRAGPLLVGVWYRADGSPMVTWTARNGSAMQDPFRVQVTEIGDGDDVTGPQPQTLFEVADIAVNQVDLGPFMSSLKPGDYQINVFEKEIERPGGVATLTRHTPEQLAEWDRLEATALEDSSQLGPDPLIVLAGYFAAGASVERAIRLAEKAAELTFNQGKLNPAYAGLYEELLTLYGRAGETRKAEQLRTSMKACSLL